MRKSFITAALVAALCAPLSACGESGDTWGMPKEYTPAPDTYTPAPEVTEITPTSTLTVGEEQCKEAMRPYVKRAVQNGFDGEKGDGVGLDAVLGCYDTPEARIRELWVEVLREEYGDGIADGVENSLR